MKKSKKMLVMALINDFYKKTGGEKSSRTYKTVGAKLVRVK